MKDLIKEVALEVAEKQGGIIWCEYGQRTSYDAYACQLIDAAITTCKEKK